MIRLSATMAALSALAGSALAQPAPGPLVVAWFGGNWGEAFDRCLGQPFTAATGIRVVAEIGTSTVTLAKLQQEKDAPKIDVAIIDGGISELAQAAGVVDHVDPKAVPSLDKLGAGAVHVAAGSNYAIGFYYFSLGITYNTAKIKAPPTSWHDLWKPEFADAVTIPSPSNSAGVPFVYFMSRLLDAPPGDFTSTFQRLKTLKAALFFDSSGAATNAFQSGEVVIGAHFNSAAWDLADKGLPIGFAVPKEGVWANDGRIHLVKGSRRKEAGEKLIEMALGVPAQTCLAEKLYVGPARTGIEVPAAAARKLPWGEGGSVKDLRLLDWTEVNRERARIVDTWNREIARR